MKLLPVSFMSACLAYDTYKQHGFIKTAKILFSLVCIDIIRWLFNHCKWFKKHLLNKAKKQYLGLDLMLELCLTDGFIDWEDLYKRYPEIKK